MPTALTIAGSDSSAGAGVQADLKTFAAFDVYGVCAITAITAQSTNGVEAVAPLAADLVAAQIEAVAGDFTIAATKVGMLANAAIVEAVAAAIEELELPLVVVDPVLVSTTGERLLDEDGIDALRRLLLPLARVITPNVAEAEALSGVRITSTDTLREAARRLHKLGTRGVVITGGHASGATVEDLVFDGNTFHEHAVARVDSRHTHGTGCTFASAVAAGLALGRALPDATARAQQYVAGAIAHAPGLGHGRGPLDHFWEMRQLGARRL
jgi:hydroxymethylpyrimidine/phosphomethylpyrimidine kinase